MLPISHSANSETFMFYSDFSMGRWIFGIIFGLFLKESGSFPVKYSNYVSLLFRNMLDS